MLKIVNIYHQIALYALWVSPLTILFLFYLADGNAEKAYHVLAFVGLTQVMWMPGTFLCSSEAFQLLPASHFNKFGGVFLTVLFLTCINLVMSIASEIVYVHSVGGKTDICMGGFILFLIHHVYYLAFGLLLISLSFFSDSFFRNAGMRILFKFILIVPFFPVCTHLDRHPISSVVFSIASVVLSAIILCVAYRFYRRWQFANNGFLMI